MASRRQRVGEIVPAVDALELPTTADVADRVNCPYRTALHHLNKHEDEGRLSSRTVGSAKVWRVADDTDATSARERGVTLSDESTPQPSQTAATAQAGDTSAEAAGLDTVEFPRGESTARV